MGLFDFFKKNNSNSGSNRSHQSLEPTNEALKNEVVSLIKQEVKFGFDNESDILEAVWAAGFENEDQLNEEWIKEIIAQSFGGIVLKREQGGLPVSRMPLMRLLISPPLRGVERAYSSKGSHRL